MKYQKEGVIFVTFNDKAMSGWGRAEGLINKVIVECKDLKQAHRVMRNLENIIGYNYINYYYNSTPYYAPSRYLCSYYIADNTILWNR